MSTVIRVENVSKQYRLGQISTGSMAHDINRWWHTIRGRENPYLKIGEVNDRTKTGSSEYVWALKDISFDVKQGEVLGIIGRNGAGKSTLLKLLSRTTLPTTGSIKAKGRIASLLEVGTGFHPDLSGRDNIFLNGAILGMTRHEIRSKFDEIVDFAGVEKYIDTPVKRYSSGMYVRLAFGVAAHLEPDILIVDEVLAVGDIEFQKKALGKMQEVSGKRGRTVLFVSHNMAAIKQLCSQSVLLGKGRVEMIDRTSDVIKHYMMNEDHIQTGIAQLNINQNKPFFFRSVSVINSNEQIQEMVDSGDDFYLKLEFEVKERVESIELSVCLKNSSGLGILFTSLSDTRDGKLQTFEPGTYSTRVKIRNNFLLPDSYSLDLYAHHRNISNVDTYEKVIQITIIDTGTYMAPYGAAAGDFCLVLEKCDWDLSKIKN